MSSFLLPSLAILFFLCSLEKSFAFQMRKKAIESNHDPQYSHLVHLSSLLPSTTCNASTKGPKTKASLEVVHRYGPCFQLNHDKAKAPTHSDILSQDQERVNYIHSRVSKTLGHDNGVKEELDSANLPAKSGSPLGSGNYFVVVGLGTPKRDLSLVFDTGSDLTWTQCEPCAGSCYKQQDPIFDPSKSSSYSNITCTSSVCTQLTSSTGKPRCDPSSKACIYGIHYGDKSFSEGYFSRERLTVTATNVIDSFLFGCGQNNQGLFRGIAGLLGLGRHPISFVQQTAAKYNKIFSYCIPSTSSSVGHLTFGDATTNAVKYIPFSNIPGSSSFYGLDVVSITVSGTKLPVSSSTFSTGGTIIDSGTVITRLPPTAYTALRDAFRQGMKQYPMTSAQGILDTCYDLSGSNMVAIPKVSFSFGGGVTVELSAVGVLYAEPESSKQVCLAFAPNGKDSDLSIFGNVQQKTFEVVYDVGGGRVGFGVGGCK